MAAIDNMVLARDSMAAELAGEMARRAAMVANGQPAPVTYNVGGKNYQWNEWVTTRIQQIEDINKQIIMMGGGADDGLYQEHVRGYT